MARTRGMGFRSEISRPDRRRFAHWRTLSLSLVYLAMAAHVIHWRVNGKTLAPLELNEVMYTFELGIVTAGFLFMAVAMLATAIFGRFFCSWGCHVLALQDLCRWILRKLHFSPLPVRSRLLRFTPLLVLLYMFAWPTLHRLWLGQELPTWHVAGEEEGWASFVTADFSRNLPGFGVTVVTFVVCALGMVLLLGSRGFCTYVCPYGAAFGLADRLALGRIRAGPGCTQCGRCTAACPSQVRVHEQVKGHGMVLDAACLRDLECVAACPRQVLHFGFGRPGLLEKGARQRSPTLKYDFLLWEEVLMALVLIGSLPIFRGLYGRVPFLLSLALGVLGGYLLVVALRLVTRSEVRLHHWHLKANQRLLARGRWFLSGLVLLALFTAHSAMIQYHGAKGTRLYRSASPGRWSRQAAAARESLEITYHFGLFREDQHLAMLADLAIWAGDWNDAERHLREVLAREPDQVEALYDLGALLLEIGRAREGVVHLRRVTTLRPGFADAHHNLAAGCLLMGEIEQARAAVEQALVLKPEDPSSIALHQRLQTLSAGGQ